MTDDLLYKVALTMVPNIGSVQAKILLNHFTPKEIFSSKASSLEKIDGIGKVRAAGITHFKDFTSAESEILFINKYNITPLFITDNLYPKRLLDCYDAPTLLYFKGNTDLDHSKVVAIVGSRSHTEYGKTITEKLVQDLKSQDVLVVSGLAYGIDAIAHKAALQNNLPTIGVLAHGLDKMYPTEHTSLAKQMLLQGGLITEFRSKTKPDKHNFPNRNRIVAALSDAVIVVETDTKGGSMITAELANGYNKDVFAFPGKTTDKKSSGCNHLIKNNKAVLLTDAQQLILEMGWQKKETKSKSAVKELFITLNEEEKIIYQLLKNNASLSIDELHFHSGMSSSSVAKATLSLEMQNIIQSLPGKMYCLL